MNKKPKMPRIPVVVNQHAGKHQDKKKKASKYACRKGRRTRS